MEFWSKVWHWIEYNRFAVIAPVCGVLIWIAAACSTPTVPSPIDPEKQVTAQQLKLELQKWQGDREIKAAEFEFAAEDLQRQRENNERIQNLIIDLASGGVADLPGLLKLLFAGGALGAITDNIRKRGVISGLKRNS